MAGHDIIVVGGSVGALEGVIEIARGLPAGLPAALFVVTHVSPSSPSYLPDLLDKAGRLSVALAEDGEEIQPGRIYVARPDHHLLLEAGRVRVTCGPRENHFRPAVDPLFRSAALAYGPRVVGVVLSGGLDDGTAGLWAIKTRGGVAVVQDPDEARVRSMPESAMRQSRVDYCVRKTEIAPILARLAIEPAADAKAFPIPEELEVETRIAMQDNALQVGLGELGEPSMFACPECHGVMLRLKAGGGLRFRCHTGHAYTADALLAELTEAVEVSLWNAIRSVEESSLLLEHIAVHVEQTGNGGLASLYKRKAADARGRAELARRAVMEHEKMSEGTLGETLREHGPLGSDPAERSDGVGMEGSDHLASM